MQNSIDIMHKRGISRIVVVLLLIVLALIAIVIIWNLVRILIEREGEIGKIRAQLLTERMEILSVQFSSYAPPILDVSIKKNTGKSIVESTTTVKIIPLGADIISVVDLSNSMRDQKLSNAKTANKELINALITPENDNRIGLVGYSDSARAEVSSDITKDSEQLKDIIDAWSRREGTCICCGINNATEKFKLQSQDKIKVMIVMSDGKASRQCPEQNTGDDNSDTIKAACDASAALSDLTIYSVGFDTSPGDEIILKEIAKCGNGKFFSADVSELIDTYKTLSQEIKKTVFVSTQKINYLKIVFYNETSSYDEIIENIPLDIFEVKKYNFNLQGKIDNVKRIEIYPIIVSSYGEKIIGQSLDSWEQL